MVGEYDNEPEDAELTSKELSRVSQLRPEEIEAIDNALLASASGNWRKVAFIVGTAMHRLAGSFAGVPDVFYSQRVGTLVARRALLAQGNLRRMRFSEVRLSAASET
jgi:hypothetical protein